MLKSASTIALAAALIALGGCDTARAQATAVASTPQHPDFSGIWFPAGRQQDPRTPQLTPGAAAAAAEYEKAFTLDDDPGRYCQWPGMPRAIWGAPFTVEAARLLQDAAIASGRDSR